ncbi:hypothetical protein Mrose_01416 [Calidithermus roseus]|uniref:Uncharacterized protein n=1 Tax=Calidithermus roseus TaxID=1644118 RepID=A0A399ERK1_9DEIN|nr:hypothetical protein Mrose_01416 [Calidithermus roseus]
MCSRQIYEEGLAQASYYQLLEDGEELRVGNVRIKALPTPAPSSPAASGPELRQGVPSSATRKRKNRWPALRHSVLKLSKGSRQTLQT